MNKKKEKLLKNAYDKFIDLVLFDFPVDKIREIIADDVSGYGTTVDEKVLEISRLKKMVTDQREQGVGLDIQVKTIPIKYRISPDEDSAIFMDEFEISMVVDGANIIVPLRLTSVFEFIENTWMLVHLHGSKAVETEEDSWHTNEWKKKNEELQKLVDEKTSELKSKNSELELEASLERVRAVANGMKKPDDLLSICEVLFTELQNLGFDGLRNSMINIHHDEDEYFLNHDFSDLMGGSITRVSYHRNHLIENFLAQIKQTNDAFAEFTIEGKQLADWIEMRKKLGERDDPRLEKAESLNYFFYSIEKGAIGISTFKPISDEKRKLLKRYRNVFDFAYRRYMDVTIAEAQAHEAKIELALERVRARTMAMQKSDELLEAGELLYRELSKLEITSLTIGYVLMDEEGKIGWNYTANPEDGTIMDVATGIPHNKTKFMKSVRNSWKKQEAFHVIEMTPQETINHQTFIAENSINFPYTAAELISFSPERIVLYSFNFKQGYLLIVGDKRLSPEQEEMMLRFTNVFQMTYRRFLDLKQAEAQARESEIQLALERVRARTMAMQKSEELADVALVLFQQVKNLGIETWSTGFNIWHEGETSYTDWVVSTAEGRFMEPYTVDLTAHPFFKEISKAKKRGDDFFMIEEEGETLSETYRLLFNMAKIQFEDIVNAGFQMPEHQINHYVFGQKVSLMFITFEPCPEAHDIFKRLGKAFEQTYTRFLDLQKAEAQAKEAQIELALEKVRARTMAMQKSEELKDVIQLVYEQFIHLNIHLDHAGFVVDYKLKGDWHFWIADKQEMPSKITHPYFDSVWAHQFNEAKEKGICFFATNLNFEEKNKFYQDLFKYVPGVPEESLEYYFNSPGLAASTVLLDTIGLYIENFSAIPYSDEENNTLMRFGKVFQQTYTRFNDLKQAEAQAREAHIESALERVRSRSIAMHQSNELLDVIKVVSEQLRLLGFKFDNVSFGQNIHEKTYDFWISMIGIEKPMLIKVPFIKHPMFDRLTKARKKKLSFWADTLTAKQHGEWLEHVFKHSALSFLSAKKKELLIKSPYARSVAFMPNIFLVVVNYKGKPYSDQENKIIVRFAKVFEQTYTRFLDLQKAEEQAKQAQVEAALEKVRGSAMAMHKSEQLSETAKILFEQFESLGKIPDRMGIGIFNEDIKEIELWVTDQYGSQLNHRFFGSLEETTSIAKIHKAWKAGKNSIVIDLSGQDLKDWIKYIRENMKLPIDASQIKGRRTQQAAFFSQGILLFTSNEPVGDETMRLLVRFAKVFDQAYIRFLDLQKAEAQAKEAIKQASLDRVRAQIASMRSTDDLQRITPLIWHELETLEVPFNRCGVFIVDEAISKVRVYLSTPDGKSLAMLNMPTDANQLTRKTVEQGRKKSVYRQHWNKKDFINWTQSMIDMGQIHTQEEYQGNNAPPEKLDLHFIPFSQGMLYVGNSEPLSEDKIDLVKSLAKAFAVAYARYEDFRQLEDAKNKIESTLTDLKATQTQLVQSEKMASLGELTAGIAHEIQNPLNFVNNFSEVSSELIDEMNEEIEKGDYEEVKAIAADVKQNLEKINHHGKRADAIVKGMLQHSRSSSGVKEPTDINALADEYLRLAYHGLRAKDKSFNATMKTDFDETIGKINVVPQDIGRVILNLITNAFYVVDEKKKQIGEGFEPTVSVRTKKDKNKIYISVKDNGNGIPQHVLDKIFQPFFTTKPTGQGTGLGLSMSYDIVTKGHGGELKVQTKEGEGSEFIIILPIT